MRRLPVIVLLSILVFPFTMAQSPVPSGAKVEKIATGFEFTEGPLWKDGAGLLFSDTHRSIIYLWRQSDSSVQVYLKPSDSSNGLTFDHDGNLILTQMLRRRISRQEKDGSITPLASTYMEKKFNSPNDIIVTPSGSIYFTDPDFNTPAGESKELTFQGIYRYSPSSDSLILLDGSLKLPNGICLSPDGKKLYVNDSQAGKIYMWDVVNDSTISNKTLLYSIPLGGYADGMKVDQDGNIYCTGPTGVWIVSPSGTQLDKIAVPETPSNCAWGDADRKTLYITAQKSIYRIRLAPATKVKDEGMNVIRTNTLFANYPNPFNPTTAIDFRIHTPGYASLKIFDLSGKFIATLFSGQAVPGTYSRKWNASEYPSGVYLCSLQSQGYAAVKKMLLLK